MKGVESKSQLQCSISQGRFVRDLYSIHLIQLYTWNGGNGAHMVTSVSDLYFRKVDSR